MMTGHSSRLSMSAYEFASPARPVPKFFQEPSFSQKKHLGGTPRDAQPPRLPGKSLSSVSRLFPHRSRTEEHQPRNVSFRHSENSVLASPHYNQHSSALYFDQCFTVEGRLGAGSFGEVFQVRSREDGKYYAVKRSRERFKGESDKRRKLEEVRKHESLLRHPNCVEFHRAWAERGHLYIQTELCKMSLQAYADQNHNIPESVLWSFLVDLIQGLSHMHNHGLLHLDIKPENIFISFDGVCKLGDFGLSVHITEDQVTDAQEGDPKYLAPELLQGHFGKHADVFSLGITILELASDLELPRNGESWHDLRKGRLPWHLTAGISPALKSLIESMMNPDFMRRPTLATLMGSGLVQQTIAWQRRRRLLRRIWNKFFGWISLLFAVVVGVVFRILKPLMGSRHGNQGLEEGDGVSDRPRHPSEWDLSFSDDEIFESDTSHGSLGCPLGSLSFSSEEEPSAVSHRGSRAGRSFQIPATPMHMKSARGPTPRSSSPISTGIAPARLSQHPSPNVSLVQSSRRTYAASRIASGTPRGTPRGTPSKLNFSSASEESDSERKISMIEPRSLSLEFDQLGDESD